MTRCRASGIVNGSNDRSIVFKLGVLVTLRTRIT
jgi:hypothetical protein